MSLRILSIVIIRCHLTALSGKFLQNIRLRFDLRYEVIEHGEKLGDNEHCEDCDRNDEYDGEDSVSDGVFFLSEAHLGGNSFFLGEVEPCGGVVDFRAVRCTSHCFKEG